MKYAFIKAHQKDFSVRRMCALMEVSPSAYYDWLNRPECERRRQDRRLTEKVVSIHQANRGIYGARRIRHEVKPSAVPACAA